MNRSYEAKVHFGSRSLIIELVNEPRAPMTKYLFKHFAEEPSLCKLNKLVNSVLIQCNLERVEAAQREFPLSVKVTKLIEIPCSSAAPQPYKQH